MIFAGPVCGRGELVATAPEVPGVAGDVAVAEGVDGDVFVEGDDGFVEDVDGVVEDVAGADVGGVLATGVEVAGVVGVAVLLEVSDGVVSVAAGVGGWLLGWL